MDRRRREKWQAAGARDSYQLALEKTRTILQNHQPDPLPENILAELRRIIAETEKELV
jgi:trimethylamine--corrinoid protein Co-methyltransferase